MASSPGPFPPETTPQRATTISRAFTVPSKLSTPSKPTNPPPSTAAESIETLYNHPNANIIKFKPSGSQASSSSRPQSSPGTLPWASPTEHTVTSGPLEIYRVPGSVSFLSSGKFLQPVLPRSQFWCVDGVSKFAFRAKEPDTYYRVELPAETEEEVLKVEEFKATLQKVSFYERTPCPFSRTFTVELPAEPEVRKKRRRNTGERAKKWKLDHAYGWRPEGWEPGVEVEGEDDAASASASGSSAGSEDESGSASGQEEVDELADDVKDMNVSSSARTRAMEALRSASAPQPSIIHSTPPSRLRTRVDVDGTVEEDELVGGDETDQDPPRLRSFQAIPTDMPPSPPDSSAGLDYRENRAQVGSAVEVESAVESEDTLVGAERMEQPTMNDDTPRLEPDSSGDVEGRKAESVDSTIEEGGEETDRTSESADVTPPPPRAEERDVESVDGTIEEHMHEPDQPVEKTIAAQPITEPEDEEETEASQSSPSEDKWPEVEEEEDTSQHTLFEDQQQPEDEKEEDTSEHTPSEDQQQLEDDGDVRPTTPPNQISPDDPYAAIQARILARRSLSGTTSFHPLHKSSSTSSTSSSSATIISNKASRASRGRRQREDASTSLANRAYSVFLGPPAHLVAAMLRIAARFANGAFGVNSMFYVESPIDSPRKVPGSYRLRGDGVEEMSSDSDSDWKDEEDDFGVPLNRPASNLAELRERSTRGWGVD